jgi:tetratricopeptide (TPR) repeat protein
VGDLVSRTWCRGGVAVLLASLGFARPGASQLPEAEDAYTNGEYRLARLLYDSVLSQDSLNPRALYRLAILDSWEGNLRLSLARFAVLRRLEPHDTDIMVAHARVLSWDGEQQAARALYDSVLALAPDRVDALAGRARSFAWDGDLLRAERLWRRALETHPNEPELLVGLGQTLYWEGASTLAEGYVARAVALAPSDPTARDLMLRIRAEHRPELLVTSNGTDDSDHNSAFLVTGTFAASLRDDLRGTVRGTWRRDRDVAARTGFSDGVDGWLVKRLRGAASVRAGAGLWRLDPDSGPARTLPAAQLGVALRPAPLAAVNIGYTHAPFDETTELLRRGYAWDELETSLEISPRPALDVSAEANMAWLSDGNRRFTATAGVMKGVWRGLHLGAYSRVTGYRVENPGRGYFSPGRYLLGEGRAVYNWRRPAWEARASTGLGVQQVGSRGSAQLQYHGDLTVARNWRAVDELALVVLFTNSAASRTGAEARGKYRYWSIEMRYHHGL